jgi:hypothetical protein
MRAGGRSLTHPSIHPRSRAVNNCSLLTRPAAQRSIIPHHRQEVPHHRLTPHRRLQRRKVRRHRSIVANARMALRGRQRMPKPRPNQHRLPVLHPRTRIPLIVVLPVVVVDHHRTPRLPRTIPPSLNLHTRPASESAQRKHPPSDHHLHAVPALHVKLEHLHPTLLDQRCVELPRVPHPTVPHRENTSSIMPPTLHDRDVVPARELATRTVHRDTASHTGEYPNATVHPDDCRGIATAGTRA